MSEAAVPGPSGATNPSVPTKLRELPASATRPMSPSFGTPPAWTVRSVGYGAAAGPGLCRILVGETA